MSLNNVDDATESRNQDVSQAKIDQKFVGNGCHS